MPTSLIIADLLDSLVTVVEAARIAAKDNQRWLNAINTGYNWLLQQDSILFDLDHHELTVPSASTAGHTYRANGACQCEAFAQSNACWHRAAARLVRRAREHRAQQSVVRVLTMERDRKRREAEDRLLECFN